MESFDDQWNINNFNNKVDIILINIFIIWKT